MTDSPKARLGAMSPDLCRKARQAVNATHRQVAEAIGESVATVFRYEMGKPTDEAVVAKLRAYFQPFQIQSLRDGSVHWYEIGPHRPDED